MEWVRGWLWAQGLSRDPTEIPDKVNALIEEFVASLGDSEGTGGAALTL